MFIKNKRQKGTILTEIFVAPLFFQSMGNQSVGAQRVDVVELDTTKGGLKNLVFSSNVLKVLGYSILGVVIIVGLVYLLRSGYDVKQQDKSAINIKKMKTKSQKLSVKKSDKLGPLKIDFDNFCKEMAEVLKEEIEKKEVQFESTTDTIKVTYLDNGGYISVSIDKRRLPKNLKYGDMRDCVLDEYTGRDNGKIGMSVENGSYCFYNAKQRFKEYVGKKRTEKFKKIAEKISSEYSEKMEVVEVSKSKKTVNLKLKNGIACSIYIVECDSTKRGGKFYPIVVNAKEGKEVVDRESFICFSDAEKYFEKLVKKN